MPIANSCWWYAVAGVFNHWRWARGRDFALMVANNIDEQNGVFND